MLIEEAGGAPPAGRGSATSVFTAIMFHSVTALPAACPLAGTVRPPSTTTSVTAAATTTRMDLMCVPPFCADEGRFKACGLGKPPPRSLGVSVVHEGREPQPQNGGGGDGGAHRCIRRPRLWLAWWRRADSNRRPPACKA